MNTIKENSAVTFHYTLKDDAGTVLDTSFGQEPMAYLHGHRNIVPGLETELEGLKKGDKKKVKVAPEDGYGVRNDDWIQEVDLNDFGANKNNVEVDAQFYMEDPNGEVQIATVTAINGEKVTVDLNHPLADQTLHFDIEVIDVREATSEELDHGHIHGPGGVHHDHDHE